MRLWPVAIPVIAAVSAACAPPDPFDEVDTGLVDSDEPSVFFVHPPQGESFEAELDEDCFLRVLIAVDVDNFTLFEPESRPPADNEGHMHIAWGGATGGYLPISDAAYLLEVDALSENLTAGVVRNFRVSLQANDHSDLDQFENWDASVEYTLTDPSGACF